MKNIRKGFYVRVNDEEDVIIKSLKDDYAINISGAFKVFLRQYLNYLDKLDIKFSEVNKNEN